MQITQRRNFHPKLSQLIRLRIIHLKTQMSGWVVVGGISVIGFVKVPPLKIPLCLMSNHLSSKLPTQDAFSENLINESIS